jgi:predicted esterase
MVFILCSSTPVLLGHAVDDAFADIELGKQARNILTKIGLVVQWREHIGAEEGRHWFKESEQLDDIAEFLEAVGKPEKVSL